MIYEAEIEQTIMGRIFIKADELPSPLRNIQNEPVVL